jgi:hypothetical protein
MSRHADSIRQQLGSGHALPGNWLKNRLKPADDIARLAALGDEVLRLGPGQLFTTHCAIPAVARWPCRYTG